jgi:hypothetical protein
MGNPPADENQAAGNNITPYNPTGNAGEKAAEKSMLKK